MVGGSFEKDELLEDIGLVRHSEARIEYRFDSEEVFISVFLQ